MSESSRGGSTGKDLRTYLDELLAANPAAVKVVEEQVDPEFESTAIVHKILNDDEYPGFPAVLFKKVGNSPVPMLLNLHGTYERVALSIGSDVHGMVDEYARREGSGIPPVMVSSDQAPVHEVVWTGDQIDITSSVHRPPGARRREVHHVGGHDLARPRLRAPERGHLPPPGPDRRWGS
jgi:3-polyprenyl-4-hydroxybenzoate decarboxylase